MPSISLDFINNYGIYIFVFLLLPVLFLYKMKVQNFNNGNITLTQNINQQLQGLFIVVVILHHISQKMEVSSYMQIFHNVGYLVVGGFFFISGVGLSKSLKLKEDYLQGFLYKKIMRVFMPFFIINLLTVAVLNHNHTFSFLTSIQYLVGLKLIDNTLWFIETIMLFYLFFYISFIKRKNFNSIVMVTFSVLSYIVLARYLGNGPWTYISSLCFLLGIYYISYEQYVNTFIANYFFTLLISSLVLFALFFILEKKLHFIVSVLTFLTPVIFVIFVFILFLKFQPMGLVFNLIGKISLEMYLLHMKILLIFSYFTYLNSGLWIISYFTSLALASYMFSKLNSNLYTRVMLVFNK